MTMSRPPEPASAPPSGRSRRSWWFLGGAVAAFAAALDPGRLPVRHRSPAGPVRHRELRPDPATAGRGVAGPGGHGREPGAGRPGRAALPVGAHQAPRQRGGHGPAGLARVPVGPRGAEPLADQRRAGQAHSGRAASTRPTMRPGSTWGRSSCRRTATPPARWPSTSNSWPTVRPSPSSSRPPPKCARPSRRPASRFHPRSVPEPGPVDPGGRPDPRRADALG